MTTTRISLGLALVAGINATTSAGPPSSVRHDNNNRLESFTVARNGAGLLVLSMSVAGKVIGGVLDTGSEISVYDKSLRPLLGTAQGVIATQTPQGSQLMELFVAPRPSIGRLRLIHDSEMVLCSDLAEIRRVARQDVRALIGMDLLRRSIVRINLRQGLVEFKKEVGLPRKVAIPLKGEMDGPSVAAALRGFGPVRFVIDTGSAGPGSSMLDRKTFDALLKCGYISQERALLGTGIFGTTRKQSGRLKTALELGDKLDYALFFTRANKNTLGLGYLSKYIVTFDFPGHRLYLEPQKKLGQLNGGGNKSVRAAKRDRSN